MVKLFIIISIIFLVPLFGVLFTGHPSPLGILGVAPVFGILGLIGVWFRKSLGLILYSLVSLFIFLYPLALSYKDGGLTGVNLSEILKSPVPYYLLFFPISALVFWIKHEPFTPFSLPKLFRVQLWIIVVILVMLLILYIDSHVIPGGFVDYILNLIIQ
ncbi:MAG: hypothetical protein A2860_01150 [Candidatus Levybacteria bacterium RIFCSPHIGHO2_01_FULL_37_33]|uniref:Uncharacterized protein n=2 Tax=Candidatus Zambryskiibacteriota TaxID=1817925 RepID=A0A1G2T728_9BACT|nr:MAG: hypothetical protein UT81_C0006G0034 [Parcubacteria group bacterium GW2011_GWA2_40_14]OGH14704.1 MAG: hypothetical protein A2860_01150 [Candidatus Levybacteria bacterium RIFCSPHIGHO2_01_FULL_37_33]OHA92599.1 MAG: hypothetical protein A2W58_01825 [Candidatus Zambryskibacteria bacterium RIFCSPHIGHO2_02_38_10.5]OHA97734.1 MAG: hypothetical protein A3E32_00970 [Candidatus Zambryskibacteria bacterium RIFCSPHIGHO2_12_FULL_38_37]OHB08678.1 MAG: hypothetical protein A2W64_02105 [Candidatus Zamb